MRTIFQLWFWLKINTIKIYYKQLPTTNCKHVFCSFELRLLFLGSAFDNSYRMHLTPPLLFKTDWLAWGEAHTVTYSTNISIIVTFFMNDLYNAYNLQNRWLSHLGKFLWRVRANAALRRRYSLVLVVRKENNKNWLQNCQKKSGPKKHYKKIKKKKKKKKNSHISHCSFKKKTKKKKQKQTKNKTKKKKKKKKRCT